MALRVPILQGQGVQANNLPIPQIRSNAPNMGAALGQGLQQVAGVASQIQAKAREEHERAVLFEAERDFREYLAQEQESQKLVTAANIDQPQTWGGGEGEAYSDTAARRMEEKLTALTAKMRPDLAVRFKAGVLPASSTFTAGARAHEMGQFEARRVSAFNGVMDSLATTASKTVDDKTGTLNVASLEEVLASGQGHIEGHMASKFSREDRDAAQKKWQSSILSQTVSKLLNKNNSTQAREVLERFDSLFTEEDKAKFSAKAKDVNDRNIGFTLAQEGWSKFSNPQTQTFDLVAATDWLKSQTGENTDAFEHAKQELSFRQSSATRSWQAAENAAVDEVESLMFKGASPSSVLKKIADLEADGRVTGKVANGLKRDYTSYWRSLNNEAKADERERQTLNLAALALNPALLKGKAPAEVLGMVKDVGASGLPPLMSLWRQVNDPETPDRSKAQIDQNDFMAVAEQTGLARNGKPVDGAGINQVRSLAEIQIQEELKKGEVSPVRRKQIVAEIATQVKLNTGFFRSTKRVFEVTAKEFDTHIARTLSDFGVGEEDAMLVKLYAQTRGLSHRQMLELSPDQWKGLSDEFKRNTPRGR
jgi:hypothetical protein